MDDANVPDAESFSSNALVSAVISTRKRMKSIAKINTSSSELSSILLKLQEQSTNFNAFTIQSADVMEKSSWTSDKTHNFLIMVDEMDQGALQKLAVELHDAVEQTKREVASLVEELRRINAAIYAITGEVESLITTVEEQQRDNDARLETLERQIAQTRKGVKKADSAQGKAFAGCGVGALVAAILCPFLIPVICCIGGVAVLMAEDDIDTGSKELTRLQDAKKETDRLLSQLKNSLRSARQLESALPQLVQDFEHFYDFWNDKDTALQAITVRGSSKLMYKKYAQAWGNLRAELGKNAAQLRSIGS